MIAGPISRRYGAALHPRLRKPNRSFGLRIRTKKFGTAAIAMFILLGLRFFGQIESLMTSLSVGALVMFCIYLAAIIGI